MRCAVTIGIATLSYHLLEQPVRRGVLGRVPRLAPATALSGFAAIAALAVVMTAVGGPQVGPVTGQPAPSGSPVAVPSQSPKPSSPMERPGRRAGERPRITIFGDSVAWTIGTYLPHQPKIRFTNRTMPGCGISPVRDIRYIGFSHHPYQGCDKWKSHWNYWVVADDPDVSVILLDRWELMDAKLNGRWTHVGQPRYDTWISGQQPWLMPRLVRVATGRG